MAIDLSLTADCVAPLESYLTDQEPTPEEVEALLEFGVEPFEITRSHNCPVRTPPPHLVAKLRKIPQFTDAQLEALKQARYLFLHKEFTLLEICLTTSLLQLATQAASEAQAPTMKSYCQTMQTNLQLKIESLIPQWLRLDNSLEHCHRYLMQVADHDTPSAPQNVAPQPCDPNLEPPLTSEQIDLLIGHLNDISAFSSYKFTSLLPPRSDRLDALKNMSHLSRSQIAQLRQYKDSLLLLHLLTTDEDYAIQLIQQAEIAFDEQETQWVKWFLTPQACLSLNRSWCLEGCSEQHRHTHQLYEDRLVQIIDAR